MWVIAARKAGLTTICTGWLVRYPQALRGGYADAAGPDSSIVHSDVHGGPANGTQITIGGGGRRAAHRSARSLPGSRRSSTAWSRSRATAACWCRSHRRPFRRHERSRFPLEFRH